MSFLGLGAQMNGPVNASQEAFCNTIYLLSYENMNQTKSLELVDQYLESALALTPRTKKNAAQPHTFPHPDLLQKKGSHLVYSGASDTTDEMVFFSRMLSALITIPTPTLTPHPITVPTKFLKALLVDPSGWIANNLPDRMRMVNWWSEGIMAVERGVDEQREVILMLFNGCCW